MTEPVLVTGANGHLGRRLLARLCAQRPVTALVRSSRAAAMLTDQFGHAVPVRIGDYHDASTLVPLIPEDGYVVHLVGIIRESRTNTFELAHERTCEAISRAAADGGAKGIVHVGVLGSDAASPNACFASRGRAEAILLGGVVPARVIAVPMVLGEGDFAARALFRQAASRVSMVFRAGSLEQPIYAGDVVDALERSLSSGFETGRIEVAGATSLSRRDLIAHAAAALGTAGPMIIDLPIALGMALAVLLEQLPSPPVTRAMLGVLDHDDAIDPLPAAQSLGIALTPLDEMLVRVKPV